MSVSLRKHRLGGLPRRRLTHHRSHGRYREAEHRPGWASADEIDVVTELLPARGRR
jgi:hypothetical protein